jgi:ABC-type multidrug transport system permease subunit
MAEAKRNLATEAQINGSLDEEAKAERYHPLVELTLARVREFLREPEAVFWVFVFPVLMAFALGIAFRNTAPAKIRVAVEDSAATAQGLAPATIYDALSRSADIQASLLAPAQAAQALRTGKVDIVVKGAAGQGAEPGENAPGSSNSSTQNETQGTSEATRSAAPASGSRSPVPVFEYRYDPTRPESRTARLAVDDALQRALGRADITSARDEKITEPGARYIDFLIPGLIGMNLMGSGMWGLGFAVVQARTRKLLKRLVATPMRRSHYLFSFMLSRLIFLVLEVVAVIGFAWIAFGVTVRGSLVDLAIVLLTGAFTFAGIGLLVASRPKTIEGVSGLMNLVMLPMWLLSGTFFSYERFPQQLHPFIRALPLTALNDSLRFVINDGAPLAASAAPMGIMLAWCVVSFILALRMFRWQ